MATFSSVHDTTDHTGIPGVGAGGGYDEGTSFPGSPATDDKYFRTDLDLLFYYDGTRWLSTTLYSAGGELQAITAVNNEAIRFRPLMAPGLDLWLVALDISVGVFGTNTGSHYWTYTLDKRASNDGITVIATKTTAAVSASTWTHVTDAIGAVAAYATVFNFLIQATVKTGTPANLLLIGGFTYRLIGT